MRTEICGLTGCEFPLFAFSHCRDVVAEVSKAGGLGVVGHTPESLEIELTWIDEHVGGKPYGVDLIVPTSLEDREGQLTAQDLLDRVADDGGSENAALDQGKDVDRHVTSDGALEEPHRQVHAPAALTLDRRLAAGRRTRAPANAVDRFDTVMNS